MDKLDRSQVLRRRLLDRLAHRHERRVTLIVAGAGFGKTTVVGQMLADGATAPSIVDVHVPIREPAPDSAALIGLLARAVAPTAAPAADLERLVDVIWGRSPDQVVLVVDDVHLLDDDASRMLSELSGRLPANGHLVLVGRRAPFQPAQRALLDGSVEVIDEHDLAFDDDELSAFERLRGSASESTGSAVTRWPALLELERASGRSGVVQYLVEELLAGLDPDLLASLRRLALHVPVDDQILAAVTVHVPVGGADDDVAAGVASIALGDIVEALPLTTWSDDRRCVVVHDLVREALVSGLDDADRRWALGRIAAVLAERGEFAAAVELYEQAGDAAAIERIARRLVDDLYMRDATEANRRLLEALRRPLGQPLVLDVLDGVLTLLDHPERARPILEDAARRSSAVGDASLETLCVLRLADDAYCAADHDALDRHAARLNELAVAGSSSARRLAFVGEVWRRSLAGRHDDVVDLVDGILAEVSDLGSPVDAEVRDFALFSWVIHRAYAGHIVDALDAADAVRRMPDGLYANRLAGFELIQRWQLGLLTAEERAAAVRLVDRIEAMGQAALFVEGAATTALFHASVGDVATASMLLERAERYVRRLPATAWPVHTVAQCRAVLQVLAGDEEAASATLRAALPPRGIGGLPRFVYGATAALSYVLLPETRPVWDERPCGPDHRLCFEVAHALVALRERGDPTRAAALPWGNVPRLRPWAYEPHLAELAVGALEAGTSSATAVFDDLRHDPQRALGVLAERDDGAFAARAAAVLRTVPRRPTDALRVTVLGPMTLARSNGPIHDDEWTRRQRVRDLFGLLVEHRTVDRATLAEAIWPEKSPDAAAGNLRYTLNQLLDVVEPDRGSAVPAWHVRSVGPQLTLVVDDLLVLDVDEFHSAMASARLEDRSGAPSRALDRYRAAIELYGGPYLAEVSDEGWGYYRRLRLQGDVVDAVTRSVDLLVGANELDEAERLAARGIEIEPLNERAAGAFVRVLLERGRVGAARETVLRLFGDLAELGIEPEPNTLELAARLGIDRPTTRIA